MTKRNNTETKTRKRKTTEEYHIYKSFLSMPDDLIIKDFNDIITQQERDGIHLTYDIAHFSQSPFQDIYSNGIQESAYSPYHRHNYFEVNYVTEGRCYEYVNGKFFCLEAGDFLIMPPSVHHSCYLTPYGLGKNFCIAGNVINRISERLSATESKHYLKDVQKNSSYYLFRCQSSQLLTVLLSELGKFSYISLNPGSANALRAEKLLDHTLSEIHYLMQEQQIEYETNSSALSISDNIFVDITKYISDNISDVTREKVENYFGVSSMSLYRILQKNNTTYQNIVTGIRQRKSLYLLKHTELSIGEIANALGFESREYFCRFFKAYRDISPSEYRKKFLAEGGEDNKDNL